MYKITYKIEYETTGCNIWHELKCELKYELKYETTGYNI
jgi:hypothetical protein